MRKILFRGKRVDNGEWVYGNLIITERLIGTECYISSQTGIDNGKSFKFSVDPSTVGQYTGLIDKNSKKIFEGDILSIAQKGNGIGDYFYPPLKYPSNAIVKWDKCSWMWEIIAEQRYYLTFPDAWCHFECKIIGDIHDNPELLEVSE